MKTYIIALSLMLSLPVVAEPAEDTYVDPDPWVKLNRGTHNFNDFLDTKLLRPVAVGYKKILPRFARTGVSNFFSNLRDVNDAINNLLQGKIVAGISDVGRVVVNSTIGIGGLLDPATPMGMLDHEEDFGQTFAVWGMPSGPYFVIPGLGPSSVRDGVGRILDGFAYPLWYLSPRSHRFGLYAVEVVQDRTDLLSLDGVVFGDKYIFYRDAYTQRREFLVNDGEVSDPFADDF